MVSGAYAFLLLALAVQAENAFGAFNESQIDEVEALLTNVKVILAGLEAYGSMWAGIDIMAGEFHLADFMCIWRLLGPAPPARAMRALES